MHEDSLVQKNIRSVQAALPFLFLLKDVLLPLKTLADDVFCTTSVVWGRVSQSLSYPQTHPAVKTGSELLLLLPLLPSTGITNVYYHAQLSMMLLYRKYPVWRGHEKIDDLFQRVPFLKCGLYHKSNIYCITFAFITYTCINKYAYPYTHRDINQFSIVAQMNLLFEFARLLLLGSSMIASICIVSRTHRYLWLSVTIHRVPVSLKACELLNDKNCCSQHYHSPTA